MELTEMYRTEEDRVNFLKGIIRLARVDGVVEDSERVFFGNLLVALAISPENAAMLTRILDADLTAEETKDSLRISFAEKPQAIFFIEEAVQLCCIDGNYHEKERAEMHTLARELGVSLSLLEQIEEWVQEGMAWQARGEAFLFAE